MNGVVVARKSIIGLELQIALDNLDMAKSCRLPGNKVNHSY